MSIATRFIAGLALSAAFFATAADEPMQPWAGPTPRLVLQDLDGRRVDLAGLRGKVVLVNFWATWCGPCVDEMPSLQRLREKLRGQPFELLTVNYGESKAKASAFAEKHKLGLPILLDGDKKIANGWRVRGLPSSYLVDAAGKVRYATFGDRDWSTGLGLRRTEELIAEARGAR